MIKIQNKMTKADFEAVPDVDIDEGVFKYVYIRVYLDSEENEEEREEKLSLIHI